MEGLALPFYSHFPLLYLAPFHREKTERQPREERLKIAKILLKKSSFRIFHLLSPFFFTTFAVEFLTTSTKNGA